MIISIITKEVRLTSLYKYILLSESLKKENIYIKIFMPQFFFNEIKRLINYLEGKKEYFRYLDQIKNLDFIACEDKTHRFNQEQMSNSIMVKNGIFDSDYILYVSDKRSKINIPNNREIINKTIAIKMRNCNDIYYNPIFKSSELFTIWVPSDVYSDHSSIRSEYSILQKGTKYNVDFVSPLELCDVPNPYIDIDIDYIYNKYNLDKDKKTILYYFTTNDNNEELIAKKFLSDNKLKEKYNLLLTDKPYQFNFSRSTRTHIPEKGIAINKYSDFLVDYVDYEWIMRNVIYCVVGGISTVIRETLVCNIPVLSISKENITRYQGVDVPTSDFFKKIFNKNISKYSQFEGLEASLEEDWISCLERIRNQEYDFKKKKKIWCGDISLEDKIKKIYKDKKT